MIKNKNLLSLLIVIVFGFVLFFVGTDGFRAYTAETARTLKLTEEMPEFPNVTLEDSKERVYSFSEFEGKYVMLTFIYTACTDVCPELEMNLAQVYNQVPEKYIGEDIIFLSISFDPERDDAATLEKYRFFFNADGDTWRMARIGDQEELNELLEAFGVIVIPDDNGNFTHNSAFYLVNPQGKLQEVMDYQEIDEAARKVNRILEKEVGDQS
ncbi:SCO family protein [Oceanobacillus halophilus]|uniref:SCO family protein n=1 Tax=Oceanobacillus halophilus TaxID=930130 RepID=A0A494ZXJ1_9BACI|nr:SCO family protein [Oceanobacillus halophilus]RKQ30758.1 SCO family protein [Oceanobacillus halophilus]